MHDSREQVGITEPQNAPPRFQIQMPTMIALSIVAGLIMWLNRIPYHGRMIIDDTPGAQVVAEWMRGLPMPYEAGQGMPGDGAAHFDWIHFTLDFGLWLIPLIITYRVCEWILHRTNRVT